MDVFQFFTYFTILYCEKSRLCINDWINDHFIIGVARNSLSLDYHETLKLALSAALI